MHVFEGSHCWWFQKGSKRKPPTLGSLKKADTHGEKKQRPCLNLEPFLPQSLFREET